MTRCLLLQSKIPKDIWTYAFRHATFIRNRCYSRRLKMTPFQMFTNKKPNIHDLKEFGTKCFSYSRCWMVLYSLSCNCKVFHCVQWYYMALDGIEWYCKALCTIEWFCMLLNGGASDSMVLHCITWYWIVFHGSVCYCHIHPKSKDVCIFFSIQKFSEKNT